MESKTQSLPAAQDPLAEALELLRLRGALFCRSELTAPWGLEMPDLEGVMMFHLVTQGRCWLRMGSERRRLEQGALALVPRNAGHVLVSDPDARAEPFFDAPVERVSERYETLRYGGGGEPTQLICVVVEYDPLAAEHLVELLPDMMCIDTWNQERGGWLESTLRFIARETRDLRPGGETVVARLADVLVIEMIRAWIDSAAEADKGWLAALRDPQIGKALVAVHRNPAAAWTVDSLALEAGMSRSAFAARFTELVGDSAGRYVARWRMRLARTMLRGTQDPIAAIADRVGYESEASFCRAFKRMFGSSPGAVRRSAAAAVV